MSKYYTPSGKFEPIAILYFILITLIAAPILGFIYSYAIWYIPFIYVNFIIAGAVGFALAWLMSYVVIKIGKVRNKWLAIGFSFIASLVALYAAWVVWVDLAINMGESYGNSRIGITASNVKFDQLVVLATNPSALFELMGSINEYGTWGIRSNAVSGTFLTIIWIIEAVLIIGATIIFTNGAAEPFCELSNQWFNSKDLPVFNYLDNAPELVKDIEQSNPSAFQKLTYAAAVDQNHSIFTLYSSKNNENYLTVTNRIAKRGKDNELEFDDNILVEHIYLNDELKDKLVNFKEVIVAKTETTQTPTEDNTTEEA
ncbi:hypothetical protein [Olleya sp. R77988]|uniref:hypothetical protein n=1 Tax=Olleya sp. R77988 TaxID=3093875 RepID=UPI0037C83A17